MDDSAKTRVAMYKQLGKYESAEKLIQLKTTNEPHSYEWMIELVIVSFLQNKFTQALNALDKMETLFPEVIEIKFLKVHILSEVEKYEDANLIYETKIASRRPPLQETSPSVDPLLQREISSEHVKIARKYLQFKQSEAAISELKKSLEVDPSHLQSREILIQTLINERNLDDALSILNDGFGYEDHWEMGHYFKGLIFLKKNHQNQAQKEWAKCKSASTKRLLSTVQF